MEGLMEDEIPNKVKIFGWRACIEILPTRCNLAKRNLIVETDCPICLHSPETEVHLLWDCPTAQDVWVGSRTKLQKCSLSQQNILHLFEFLMNKLEPKEMELFLVQAWMLWNQRNGALHGGKLKDPRWLNTRAAELLAENAQTKEQLAVIPRDMGGNVWCPPPPPFFKLNFDATIFRERCWFGFRVVIRNEQGEVMVALSTIGPPISSSEEAETLACRKAVEFAVDAGFSELIIKGNSKCYESTFFSKSGPVNLWECGCKYSMAHPWD
ncbi:uncharacterized protein LOC142644186 [Castanea sativa]|uniref:uncharacterized protein LOC142644186 n=1 Tax=Castanea sativa TaxID=21020 RepID=UPI003F64C67A